LSVIIVAFRSPATRGGPGFKEAAQRPLSRAVGVIVVIVVSGLLTWMIRRADLLGHPETGRSGTRLDLFVAGASIYVASFVGFANWDYRMVFLLLAMPQLLTWSRAPDTRLAWLSRSSTAAVLVAFVTSRFSQTTPVLYWLGQGSKGLLCVALLALLFTELVERFRRWRGSQSVFPAQVHASVKPL
jgi:hypothetical protein